MGGMCRDFIPISRPAAETRPGGSEAAVYAGRARCLGLAFAPFVHLGRRAPADLAAIRRGAFAMSTDGARLAYLAPDEDAMPTVLHWLNSYPAARSRLRVSTPSAIRAALVVAGGANLARDAVSRLATRRPDLSARRVATAGQLIWGGVIAALLAGAFVLEPVAALITINLIGAVFFFGVSALRFVAAGLVRAPQPPQRPPPANDAELPVYSVLVALYKEAEIVGDLIAALDRLDWPRERLDIKLVLEADDATTIAAARQAARGPSYEIVIVPPIGPRTKPKALMFALALARGSFVTVYDAEDRPHPGQLRQAFATFARSGPDLACLQAALVIDNGDASWLARLFAIEYAALFDGLLPALARFGMPLPLGGTSNHFRGIR